MSNIEQEIKKCIDADATNQQKLEELTIRAATVCTKLAAEFSKKFFPEEDAIKIAENFSYKKEFTIVLFREASLWWNAQKSYYPLGNANDNNGAIPLDNMAINMYIVTQIKNLELGLEDNDIGVGELELYDHLAIPADEVISRDISKILKMGEEEDLPEIKVPDVNNSSGNVNSTEEAIINQKIPDDNDTDADIPEVSEADIESVIRNMKDLKPGQKFEYKGKVVTILAPISNK